MGERAVNRPCQHCQNVAEEMCPQCGVQGHLSRQCPDNWRRYHDTVDSSASEPHRPLKDCHKRASEMYCVNCGRKGHYLHHCHAYQDTFRQGQGIQGWWQGQPRRRQGRSQGHGYSRVNPLH